MISSSKWPSWYPNPGGSPQNLVYRTTMLCCPAARVWRRGIYWCCIISSREYSGRIWGCGSGGWVRSRTMQSHMGWGISRALGLLDTEVWNSCRWSPSRWGGEAVNSGVLVPRVGQRPCQEHKLSIPVFTGAKEGWRQGWRELTGSIRRFWDFSSLSPPRLPSFSVFKKYSYGGYPGNFWKWAVVKSSPFSILWISLKYESGHQFVKGTLFPLQDGNRIFLHLFLLCSLYTFSYTCICFSTLLSPGSKIFLSLKIYLSRGWIKWNMEFGVRAVSENVSYLEIFIFNFHLYFFSWVLKKKMFLYSEGGTEKINMKLLLAAFQLAFIILIYCILSRTLSFSLGKTYGNNREHFKCPISSNYIFTLIDESTFYTSKVFIQF